MNKIDQIKELYHKLEHKKKWTQSVAKDVNRSYSTLREHYFQREWKIPEPLQDAIILSLERQLKRQEAFNNFKNSQS